MNNIPNRQNEQVQLERLAAQRELYNAAKKWHVFQLFLTVLIPVTLAIISVFKETISPYAAILGIGFFLFDQVVIDPIINRKKLKAAKIQEMFDCDVLEIPGSVLKQTTDIAVEEVLSNYNAHAKINKNIEKIKDWYPREVGSLSISLARIVCQRANCWWDARVRNRYAQFLRIFSILLFLGTFGIALYTSLSLLTFALVISSLVPFFQFCIKNYNDNIDAIDRLNALRSYSETLWANALNQHLTAQESLSSSRDLQNEIYEHRAKSALILGIFYRLFRSKDEKLMNRASEILVAEALAAGANP